MKCKFCKYFRLEIDGKHPKRIYFKCLKHYKKTSMIDSCSDFEKIEVAK
jgi:hypothetical protein